jgi:isoleucyl-tRNA synthetase
VYVKFPLVHYALVDAPGSPGLQNVLLVWTTTPWTLAKQPVRRRPSRLDYATVVGTSETGQRLIMAAALVETIAGEGEARTEVESTAKGSDLLGKRYVPAVRLLLQVARRKSRQSLKEGAKQAVAWRVVRPTSSPPTAARRRAPGARVRRSRLRRARRRARPLRRGPRPAELINAVGPDGKFTAEAPDYQGRWVKDCDKDIIRDLKQRGCSITKSSTSTTTRSAGGPKRIR